MLNSIQQVARFRALHFMIGGMGVVAAGHAVWCLLPPRHHVLVAFADATAFAGCALLVFVLTRLAIYVPPQEAEPETADYVPEEPAKPPEEWKQSVRRIERDLMAAKIKSVLAERPFRGGTPQHIWEAEMAEITDYVAYRLQTLGVALPGDLRKEVEVKDALAASQDDYVKKMATHCAGIVEKYLRRK